MSEELEHATDQPEILAALAASGISASDLDALAGTSSQPYDRVRLLELRDLVLTLAESLTPVGVGEWLRAPNRLLRSQRPIDVAATGDTSSVRAAAASFTDGSYV